MGWWGNLMHKTMMGYKAFREPDLISDPLNKLLDDGFEEFDSRRIRYAIYWAMYENTVYRDPVHKWAKAYKTRFGLYRYIRSIYNPAYRIGEFWKAHIWGGPLETAIPIETENEALLPAIMQLYEWSNWQIYKDVCTLHGSVFGDIALTIVDDVRREKVYIDIVHPGTIEDVSMDNTGNVKAYTIVESRPDPTNPSRKVNYVEKASREGDAVLYQTFLGSTPYDWSEDERGAEWVEPYGFIPMVVIQHNNVGLNWGWSELHPGRSRFAEVDDLGSHTNDYIRKAVNSPMLLAGVQRPSATPQVSQTQPTATTADTNPMPGREELPYIYGPIGAKPEPMIATLDLMAALAALDRQLKSLEDDYPELRLSRKDDESGGEKSGRALREARRDTETKIGQRRGNYDSGLVRINQMGVAIAGHRGIKGFEGFGLDSYDAGQLDHTITKRSAFTDDPMDNIEVTQGRATIMQALTQTGASMAGAAKAAGFDDDTIEALNGVDIVDMER